MNEVAGTILLLFLWLLAGFLIALVQAFIEIRYPCTCGRERKWYYDRDHERAPFMWFSVAVWSAFEVWMIVDMDWLASIVFGLIVGFHVRRWWLHEKDKMKRKAARLAGRVAFNNHGRLVVKA